MIRAIGPPVTGKLFKRMSVFFVSPISATHGGRRTVHVYYGIDPSLSSHGSKYTFVIVRGHWPA